MRIETRPSLMSACGPLLLLVLALVAAPFGTARAQFGDERDPWVVLNPASGTFAAPQIIVTMYHCDDTGVDMNTLDVRLNGVLYPQTTGPDNTYCDAGESSIQAFTLGTLGTGVPDTLRWHACDGWNKCTTESFLYLYNAGLEPPPAPVRKVVVTPNNVPGVVEPSAISFREFRVQNQGDIVATYSFTAACTGAVTQCEAPPNVTLLPGDDAVVTIQALGGLPHAAGRVELWANDVAGGASDVGSYNTVVAGRLPRAPVVSLVGPNADVTVERSLCLTIAAGAAAASECGDLRLVHALPVVKTMNTVRGPTLRYNSQHAHPVPIVAATITIGDSTSPPAFVTGRLELTNGTLLGTATWTGGWLSNTTRRIAVPVTATTLATGVHPIRLIVTSNYPGSYGTTVTGEIVVLDRQASPFGSGWWLAGVEQLVPASMLWIGGDGSTRKYVPDGAVWRAASVDRPDSLRQVGAFYVRILPQGDTVKFNLQGQHVETVNRLGHKTTFTYTGGLLTRIDLPPTGSGPYYAFTYSAGKLSSVSSPGPNGTRRLTDVYIGASARVDSIRDPDLTKVRFKYATSSSRVTSRLNRLGDTTTYSFDGAGKVSGFAIRMGTGLSPLTTTLAAAESRGVVAVTGSVAPRLDSSYALIDGPRSPVTREDRTLLWLDRFGSPFRIRNAHGDSTLVARDDVRWPALPTSLMQPNGRQLLAWYDQRGNVDSTKDLATTSVVGGQQVYATTKYRWDPKWNTVTAIIPPEKDSTIITYALTTGNRLTQRDARGAMSEVRFTYHGNGLLRTVEVPHAGGYVADSLAYDPVRFNLTRTKTPLGVVTNVYADDLGRDTLVVSPIDAAQTQFQKQFTRFDLSDQDTLSRRIGPAIDSSGTVFAQAESLTVRKVFDAEGRLTSLSQFARPDVNAVGTVTTSWVYDRAGRTRREVAPGGGIDSTRFDEAGNATRLFTRRGHTIELEYDALSRLTKRVVPAASYPLPEWVPSQYFPWSFPLYTSGLTIPADTATFTYDAMGQLRTANNKDARVSRRYAQNGALVADTLKIRETNQTAFSHVFGLKFGYDLNGRRTRLVHPQNIAPVTGGTLRDTTIFAYDVAGRLLSVRDPLGNLFRQFYDAQGRLDSLALPGGVYVKHAYDADSRLLRRLEKVGAVVLHADTLTYDGRGKARSVRGPEFLRADMYYSGLGMLVRSNEQLMIDGQVQRPSREALTFDALGNRRALTNLQSGANKTATYQAATGRHLSTTGGVFGESMTYDASGNIVRVSRTDDRYEERVANFYAADQRLRVVDRRACLRFPDSSVNCDPTADPGTGKRGAFEEYRYDALGRRIWVRSRSDSSCHVSWADCESVVERYVWDGDQSLYEIRAPGGDQAGLGTESDNGHDVNRWRYGRVAYTHAGGIDQPVGLVRMKYYGTSDNEAFPVILHTNWRGTFDKGTNPNGSEITGCGDPSTCVAIAWPGKAMSMFFESNTLYSGPPTWFGSLVKEMQDNSGQLYRRNRYYDPATGRFTQEDPIGLAGGLNIYGYAEGDPVNYSDPFGLCPEFITGRPCSNAVAIGVGFIPVVGDAYDIVSAVVGKDLLTGEDIGAVGIGATVVGTILGSGKLAREGAELVEEGIERASRSAEGAVEAAKKRRDIPDRRKPHRTEPSPSKREKHEDTRAPHRDKKRQHDTWTDNPNKRRPN